jgi:hypothetical protein
MMERFNGTIEELRDEFLFVRRAPLPESKIVLGNEFAFASGESDDVWLKKPSSIARGGPGVCSAALRIPKDGTADFTMDGVGYRLAYVGVARTSGRMAVSQTRTLSCNPRLLFADRKTHKTSTTHELFQSPWNPPIWAQGLCA